MSYQYTEYTPALSNNADLSDLTVSAGGLAFDGGATYSVSVANAVTGITVTPTLADLQATVMVNGVAVTSGEASGAIALAVGDNTVTVLVTAEDGTTQKTYTITVRRLSGDADLATLSVDEGALNQAFAAGTTSYTMNVANAVTSVTVNATTAHAEATFAVTGDTNLAVGANTVEVEVTAEDTSVTKTYTITVTRAPSSDDDLASLSVTEGTLSPAFAADELAYTVSVAYAVTAATVNAAAAHPQATVQVTGNTGLAVGDNTVTVAVTAEDGTTQKTYTITVRRLSNDADLATLSVDEGTLDQAFAAGTTSYTMNVANAVTSVTVNATTAHAQATFAVTGHMNLAVGDNTVEVEVTAEDPSVTKTYTITVTRAPSSDADLASLSVTEGTLDPAFAADELAYTVPVAYAVTAATVNAAAAHPQATVQVTGNTGLAVGDNTVTVAVTAEDGTTQKTYTITVRRLSNDADLATLSVDEGTLDPAFAAGTTSYTMNVANAVTSVTVNATTAHAQATFAVTGHMNLAVGDNTVEVEVTAEDPSITKTYTITVTRAPSSNADLASLSVTEGTLDPAFAADGLAYTVPVAYAVTDATVNATAAHPQGTVQVTGHTGLQVGNNTVTVEVTAEDGTTQKTYTITVRRLSNDANLATLSVDEGALDQAFAAGTTSYTMNVANAVTSVTVNATTAHAEATFAVTGDTDLAVDANTVEVEVTAEDTSITKIYTITVTRAPSSDANLASLSVTEGTLTPAFDADELAYTVPVAYAVTDATVNATAAHPQATAQVTGDTGLQVGDNTVTVLITAEDGTTQQTYTITVRRLSNDANLATLSVDEGALDPAFDAGTTSYTMDVANAVTGVTVNATTAHDQATFAVTGDTDLAVGANTVEVEVTAEDPSVTKTYTITVTRAPSSDANLSGLTPANGTLRPLFDPDVTEYAVRVSNGVGQTKITPTVADETATVTVNGEAVASGTPSVDIILAVGANPITVRVTAQDGETTKSYIVTVTRAAPAPEPQPAPAPEPEPGQEPEPESDPKDEVGTEEEQPADLIRIISGGDDPADTQEDVRPVTTAMVGTNLVVSTDNAGEEETEPRPVEMRAVEIGGNVLDNLASTDSSIVVQTGLGEMTVPAAAIAGAPDLPPVSEEKGSQVTYRFRMEALQVTQDTGSPEVPVAAQAVQRAVLSVVRADADGLRPAGRVLTLAAERIVEYTDGAREVTAVKTFAKPIVVRIPFDEADDPSALAVYRLNEETGKWEFRGGTVNVEERYVEIELTSFSQYTVMEYVTFDDIQEHWSKAHVERMAVRRLVKGIGNRLFAPDAQVTRAEFATLLVRLLKLPVETGQLAFDDVRPDDWFAGYVGAAARAGLIQGHEGRFRPSDPVSRQEMALMVMRAAALRDLSASEDPAALGGYGDDETVATWAKNAVAGATELGLIHGRPDGRLAPEERASRAEATVILERLMDMLAK